MATTVKQAFADFSTRVNITDLQTSLVSTRWQNVLAAINRTLYLHTDKPSLLIGSYKRQTMLKPLSQNDVDMMVVLHYGKNKTWDTPDGTGYVLNMFKEILDNSFPQVAKRRDRNCITMSYSEFRLDVVPAFSITDTGYYQIPDSIRKQWILTDPEKFMKNVSQINKNMDLCYIPMVKMMKAWNQNNGNRLEGLHLECILYSRYKDYSTSYTYSSMFDVLFTYWSTYLSSSSYDPIKGDQVDTYLSYEDRLFVIKRAMQSKDYSAKAVTAENNGNHQTAMYYWNLIFGDYFPTYG